MSDFDEEHAADLAFELRHKEAEAQSARGEVKSLKAEVLALQERVTHAELARDNAVKQRDDANDRSKRKAASAGERITKLVALVRQYGAGTWRGPVIIESNLREILGDGDEARAIEASTEPTGIGGTMQVAFFPFKDGPWTTEQRNMALKHPHQRQPVTFVVDGVSSIVCGLCGDQGEHT